MTFPHTPLSVKLEIFINGAWADITGYVYTRDDLEISRGLQAEASAPDPGRCAFTVNNRDGQFSPRNPTGLYYGTIGRNTPVRVSIPDAVDTGPEFDASSEFNISTDASWTHTPNGVPKGVLVLIVQNADITDQVVSVTYGGVALTEMTGSPLIHSTGAEDGVVYGFFLGDGIPVGPQTVAVDVNATGSPKAFKCLTVTAPTTTTVVDDTTTLDSGGTADPTVTLTTTKKTRNFAVLHSGHDATSSVIPAAGHSSDGTAFDFGTQVADFIHASALSNAGSPTIGWTATSEEAGVLGVAIRNGTDYARFYGEIPAWPTQWDKSGHDVWVPVEAAGILRRLGQGQPPLRSAPYRYAVANDAHAFWPLDDQSAADFGAPGIGDNPFSLRKLGSPSIHPGEGELAAWLPNGVRVHSSTVGTAMDAQVGLLTAASWAVDVPYAGQDVGTFNFQVYSGDGAVIWRVHAEAATGNLTVRLRTTGESGTETTISTLAAPSVFDGGLHTLRLWTDQNGANVDYIVYLDGMSVISATTAAAIIQDGIGQIRLCGFAGSSDVDVNYGNVAVWNGTGAIIPPAADYFDAVFGHLGETAGARIQRLCTEEGIGFQVTGGTAEDSAALGPQYADTFLDIVQEAATTDGGILHEPREFFGLGYCTRAHLYNQTAALALTYSGSVFGTAPIPVDDDRFTRNDITAQRRDGSSARAILESGALSILAPPDGVGIYDDQATVNVPGDGKFLEDQAAWRLHLGTVDEARYPVLHLNLASLGFTASPSLALDVVSLDVCDRLTVADMPTWLPPDTVSLIAQGFTEVIGNGGYGRDIYVNCMPESPYQVSLYESGTGSTVNKYDTDGSELSAGINSSATSLSVAITQGPLWTAVDAEDGFDIYVGGERMTVTDISGAASPQTFTVTRSVNGVVKSHSAGAAVRLWQTPTYAL